MWLCGAPYLPGLDHCWYPLCLLMPHTWPPHLTSLSCCRSLTSSRLSSQEARAEWGRQGEAPITGSPSPPPGTGRQVHARHGAALLGRLALKHVAEGEECHRKKKGRKIASWAAVSFYSFKKKIVLEHFFHRCHFVLFLLELCECYFRWLFVLLLQPLHLIESVETSESESWTVIVTPRRRRQACRRPVDI